VSDITYKINDLPELLTIGYLGEGKVQEIRIDCLEWIEKYPAGVIEATFIEPQSREVLQMATRMDGSVLVIPVTKGMTRKEGAGSVNIRKVFGEDGEKRSAILKVVINKSHSTATGVVPSVAQELMDQVMQKLAAADGEKFIDAFFESNDLVFIKANSEVVRIEGAKTTLTGPPGDASEAIENATRAAESATNAAGAASQAASEVNTAKENANAAAESANEAAGAAGQAAQEANAAKESASQAASSATSAAAAATQAAAGATSAANFAGQAATSAANAASAANQIAESVATAEEQREIAEQQRQTDTSNAITGAEAATNDAEAAAATANAAAAGIDDKLSKNLLWRQAAGNPVQVYPVPQSTMYPIITITPTQSGSGDPSPDNIRPIVGVGNVDILHTGKNLLPRMTAAQYQSVGITATRNDDGSITLDGTATSIAYIRINQEPEANIHLNPGAYVQSLAGAVSGVSIITKLANPPGTIIVSGQNNFTVTKRTEALFTYLYIDNGTTLNNLRVYPQIEIGSTATPYEPYEGASHAVTLPETLYGGLVDLETGVFRRERAVKAFDGTEAWSAGTIQSNGAFRTSLAIPDMIIGSSMNFVCSHLKTGAYSGNADANTVAFGTNNTNYISVAVIANNVAEFKSWLAAQHAAGTPVTICYKLATPAETPIAPLTLTALQRTDRYTPRQNVISVSAGALTLGYAKSLIRQAQEIDALIEGLTNP
jgi:hypothetical protein